MGVGDCLLVCGKCLSDLPDKGCLSNVMYGGYGGCLVWEIFRLNRELRSSSET